MKDDFAKHSTLSREFKRSKLRAAIQRLEQWLEQESLKQRTTGVMKHGVKRFEQEQAYLADLIFRLAELS